MKNYLMEETVKSSLLKTQSLLNKLLESKKYISCVLDSSNIIINAISRNNSVFLAGNGGSAAHSQHFAAEFVSRFNLAISILCSLESLSIKFINNLTHSFLY